MINHLRIRIQTLGERGFTLVELLVVMVLLSLLMVAMGSALRTTSQTEERVDRKLDEADEMRVAVDFVRITMGRVSMAKVTAPVAEGQNQFGFSGLANEVSWIGIMPARYGAGGRYHFRLAAENGSQGRDFVMRFAPWSPDSTAPDWSSAAAYVLVKGITQVAFRYQDASPEPPQWTDKWSIVDRLPQRVMVSVITPAGPWPVVIAPMRVLPAGDPSSSAPTFGGRS